LISTKNNQNNYVIERSVSETCGHPDVITVRFQL